MKDITNPFLTIIFVLVALSTLCSGDVYILKHDSREAAKASWKAFGSDPAWKKAAKESGVGRLAKAPESIYMKATDYSAIR